MASTQRFFPFVNSRKDANGNFAPVLIVDTDNVLIPAVSPYQIKLREIPNSQTIYSPTTPNISIPGFTEVITAPASGQFRVDYTHGYIWFNSVDAGTPITITYYGLGSALLEEDLNCIDLPASYTDFDDITIPGWYYAQGCVITNVPFVSSSNDLFIRVVQGSDTDNYIVQQVYDTTINKLFIRFYTGSWSDWIEQMTELTNLDSLVFVGFINRTQTNTPTLTGAELDTVNLVDAGAGWTYFFNGKKITITGNKTVALTGGAGAAHIAGTHYIYIDDETGTLKTSVPASPWSLDDLTKVFVATVKWNGANPPGSRAIIADERHTIKWPRDSHREHHNNDGTKKESGGAISGYVQMSTTEADRKYSLAEAVISDEDIRLTLSALVGADSDYFVFYHNADGSWMWDDNQAVPFKYDAGGAPAYIMYDTLTGLVEMSAGNFVNTYVCFTNISGNGRFAIIHGQTQWPNLTQALANENIQSLNLTGLPIQEIFFAYKITWRTGAGYANVGLCRIENVQAINLSNVAVASLVGTDHQALNNRDANATHPIESISGNLYKKVRCATVVAGTLATDFGVGDAVDGITLAAGDIILIKNQAAGAENGIYEIQADVGGIDQTPLRVYDYQTSADIIGSEIAVQEGTVNIGMRFYCTNVSVITVDTTPIFFESLDDKIRRLG